MRKTFHLTLFFVSALIGQSAHGAINGTNLEENKTVIDKGEENSVSAGFEKTFQSTSSSDVKPPSGKNENEINAPVEYHSSVNDSDALPDRQLDNINAINKFARKMNQGIFRKLDNFNKTENGGTLIWSPFSVYQSLVPLFYGADGETQKELRNVLLPNSGPDEREAAALFITDFSPTAHQDLPKNDAQNMTQAFSSATSLFFSKVLRLDQTYVNVIGKYVKNVELKSVDFVNASSAVEDINSWVHEKSQGLINEAVDESQLDQNMLMMIVNCVRFKAPWASQFNSNLTANANFYGFSGVREVQMMHKLAHQWYGEFPRASWIKQNNLDSSAFNIKPFSVIEMPYEGTDIVSLFILPKSSEDVKQTLDYIGTVGVRKIMNGLMQVEVDLSMPKFRISSDIDVVRALEESGLRTVFSPSMANLTKIFSPPEPSKLATDQETSTFIPPPYISKIVHRTIFETSEEGTSAGALTTVSIVPLSSLGDQRTFKFNLNRPFIVMLVKNETVLFEGIIADLVGQGLIKENSTENVESSTRVNIPMNEQNREINDTIGETSPTVENETTDERAWWKRKGVPEYLKLNLTSDSQSAPVSAPVQNVNSSESKGDDQNPNPPALSSSPSPLPPNTFIQFTKYQQPEPADPNGIRFPMTFPVLKHKAHIRPRYDPYYLNYHKRHLLRRSQIF